MSVLHRTRRQDSALGAVESALFAVPLVAALVLGYRQRWVAEDAFITLRVVDNLLAGHGPVFNIGERVEVYTHPLWLFLITVPGATGIRPEMAAIYIGLALSIAGLAAAQVGAMRLTGQVLDWPEPRRTLAIPAGGLVFVSIPVVWDFLTSGLETGLTFAWLGVSFWLLVRRALIGANHSRSLPLVEAAVFGLGPLVRPDLGLFAVAFLAVLIACEAAGRTRRERATGTLWLLLGFAGIPGIYQVFRMGYFAMLVPNTALAKEASSANWGRGWVYLTDFTGSYYLWIPLVIVIAGLVALLARAAGKRDYRAAIVIAAPVIAAIAHALYVVRVGGDFMHGRLLLPSLFGLLLPVAAVTVPVPDLRNVRVVLPWFGLGAVAIWCVACAALFRWEYSEAVIREGIPQGIINERQFFVEQTGNSHPMTVEDYLGTTFEWVEHGLAMRDLAATYPRIVLTDLSNDPLGEHVDRRIALVIYARSIGVQSHAVGESVWLVDLHGLGDPLASRMKVVEAERPGHEKELPLVWIHARFADLEQIAPLPADLQAAADVLRCGDVEALISAVEEPLTLGRFADNVRLSWRLTRLKIDPDPLAARDAICGAPR